jgi:hypothetical protein
MCAGIQIHTEYPGYQHDTFKPYRLYAGFLKSLRKIEPGYDIWRYHEYEYELDRTPIDVINGGPALRQWVDDPNQSYEDIEVRLMDAETRWLSEREPHLIYPTDS